MYYNPRVRSGIMVLVSVQNLPVFEWVKMSIKLIIFLLLLCFAFSQSF